MPSGWIVFPKAELSSHGLLVWVLQEAHLVDLKPSMFSYLRDIMRL